jgi:phosphatidylethanolamine-binding protein (PEBP) family uncharacterized protein
MRRVGLLLLGAAVSALAAHPDEAWDEAVDPACCPYPEHDPRDFNWPYSHFQYAEVIPDVVGSFVSMASLNLTYAGGAAVAYGKPLAPAAVARPPAVAFALEPDRDASTLHTLMMVDPDAPFRDSPADGEWLHWLVYDIPGNDTANGKTLAEYAPPAPQPCPAADRLCLEEHRVTFILWEQPHGHLALHDEDRRIGADETEGRKRYKARDFAARHRLGLQIAMNFFETWHDAGDGSFGTRPWYYVRDSEQAASAGGVAKSKPRSKVARKAKKDEL